MKFNMVPWIQRALGVLDQIQGYNPRHTRKHQRVQFILYDIHGMQYQILLFETQY